jgi:4,5-dihydroxyphthalate decarboxylase
MSKLRLTLAVADYDRTKAIFQGRTPIEGVELVPLALGAEECFHRAFKYQEFDVCELSLSSHSATTSRSENHYIGIPAFVSRVFRHSGIYVRTDRGIKTPQDLRGRTVGLPEYQITANVWIRGILQDDYGVKPSEIRWRRGGIEEPGRGERSPIQLPRELELLQIPGDKTLSGMLEAGEIDAMITARAPSCFDRRAPNVGRLFPDFKAVEQEYFKRTGIFPIMHLIGIRKSLVAQYPWLPVNLYNAFLAAKKVAVKELYELAQLMINLPWAPDHYAETVQVMGEDFWPYGFNENRKTLETFLRYHHEQGLSSRRVAPEELFAESTFDLAKI